MENIDRYLTPCKLGRPVLGPSGVPGTYNERAVDCPFVFTHNGMYYMLHVGFDGRGYQTALSESADGLRWSEGRPFMPVPGRLRRLGRRGRRRDVDTPGKRPERPAEAQKMGRKILDGLPQLPRGGV